MHALKDINEEESARYRPTSILRDYVAKRFQRLGKSLRYYTVFAEYEIKIITRSWFLLMLRHAQVSLRFQRTSGHPPERGE